MNNNLKKLRKTYGKTQAEFAASLSMPTTTYSQYESGSRQPHSDFWEAVAEKYHVSIDYLMGLTDNPKATKYADRFQISPEEIRLISAWRQASTKDRRVAAMAIGFRYEPEEKETQKMA